MRTLEYYDFDLIEWFDTTWSGTVSGTLIRITEEDSTPVVDGTGVHEVWTMSDAYQITISGIGDVWHIDIADPDPVPVPRRAE